MQEIHEANDKCIFCLDQLAQAKRINCGHLFHDKCLRSYFENSSNPKCPTCRADINEKIIYHRYEKEEFSQSAASSFIFQDLPYLIIPKGTPLDIGALNWGLPQEVIEHKISCHNEKMRKIVENMNEFITEFYKHPPDQEENSENQIKNEKQRGREEHYKQLRETFLKNIENNLEQ